MNKDFLIDYGIGTFKRKPKYIFKGRQLGLKTISKRFEMFWDIRKPCWKGTDIELVDDIFNDPDFIDGLPFKVNRKKEENLGSEKKECGNEDNKTMA